jgi:DNA-directed RNA polymerase specialized sigma subunit
LPFPNGSGVGTKRHDPDQSTFLTELGLPEDAKPKQRSVLNGPLTREQRYRIGRQYAKDIKLVTFFTAKLGKKFGHCIAKEDIASCVDMGFIKAAVQFDESRGFKFSTLFYTFAHGECTHYMRQNWTVGAPQHLRTLGAKARQLLEQGMKPADVCAKVGCTLETMRNALEATAGVVHETNDWQLHACPRPTPWDVLEAEEQRQPTAVDTDPFSG